MHTPNGYKDVPVGDHPDVAKLDIQHDQIYKVEKL